MLSIRLFRKVFLVLHKKKDVSVREQSAYSYNLGYNDGIHHFGVQVAGTFVKLFPFLLSVNYQIDFLNWKGFLFSMSTMYGGIRYDRERYGGLVMASYRDGYRNYFASIQYLKSRRHFYSANAAIDGINGAPDNSLSYLLQSTTTSAGIRFSDNQHSKASIELGLGWENNLVLDQYNIQIQPINYSHSDGAVIFASVIIPFQNLNLPNSSKEFE